MLFLLAYLYVQLCNIFVYGLCICFVNILGNWLISQSHSHRHWHWLVHWLQHWYWVQLVFADGSMPALVAGEQTLCCGDLSDPGLR